MELSCSSHEGVDAVRLSPDRIHLKIQSIHFLHVVGVSNEIRAGKPFLRTERKRQQSKNCEGSNPHALGFDHVSVLGMKDGAPMQPPLSPEKVLSPRTDNPRQRKTVPWHLLSM